MIHIILLTYIFYSTVYPDSISGFVKNNAFNGGVKCAWNCFYTSPNGSICLDDVAKGHEFTHSLNTHFTDTITQNEQGAVMEAVADMVGYSLAASIDEKYNTWLFSGNYSAPARCFYDPNLMGTPKYIGGLYYVSPINNGLVSDDYLDYGGVHANNCIVDYLGYTFVEGETSGTQENITLAESADLWFEAVTLTNYDTDFKNLGAYLKYAVKQLNLSEGKQEFVCDTIKRYGFEDGNVDPSLLTTEGAKTLNITYVFDEGLNAQDYSKGVVIALVDSVIIATLNELSEDVMIPENKEFVYEYMAILDNITGTKYTTIILSGLDVDKPAVYNAKKIELGQDETYTISDSETVVSGDFISKSFDTNTVTYANVGSLVISVSNTDSNNFNVYMVCAKQ